MAAWFYEHNGESIGPIDEEIMRQWSAEGKLRRGQRVRRDDQEAWRQVEECPELTNRELETEIADSQHVKGAGPAGYPFETDGSRPLARVAQAECAVLAEPAAGAARIGMLRQQDLIELCRLWKRKGEWIEIRIASDRMGYIPAATVLETIPRVGAIDEIVVACMDPDTSDDPVVVLPNSTRFWYLGMVHLDAESRVQIRMDSGRTGCIAASTRTREVPQIKLPVVNSGQRDLMVGGLWCIGGILATAITFSRAQAGDGYLLCWGPIIFGGLQFLYGLYHAVTAEKPTVYAAPTASVNAAAT